MATSRRRPTAKARHLTTEEIVVLAETCRLGVKQHWPELAHVTGQVSKVSELYELLAGCEEVVVTSLVREEET